MSSRTFSFNTIIPRISSTTAIAPARSRVSTNSFVSIASATGLVTIVLALGFYVYMINAYASKGYELKRQQTVVQEMTETNKRLVVQQAALGSIVKVNDVAATSGMVPVTGEEFLVANQVSVR